MKDKYLISITHSLGHQVTHSSLPNALTSEIKACSLKKKENTDNELLWFCSKTKANHWNCIRTITNRIRTITSERSTITVPDLHSVPVVEI
jgi:hypothetical protein